MIIENTEMIDRCKRAHIALLARCLYDQSRPGITKTKNEMLQIEIKKCEEMIEVCAAKLKAEEYASKF